MTNETNASDTVTNRAEIMYIYDAVNTIPNGNPNTEENRPRVDRRTNKAEVTAVRIKRVIRDYLDRSGHPIFIKKTSSEGVRDDKDDRYEILMEKASELHDDRVSEREAFLKTATDVRLFGEAMAFNAYDFDTDEFIGPVQFSIARSLNEVDQKAIGKTSVMNANSSEGGDGGNMYTDHRLPYALINVHGTVDPFRAQDTLMTDDDIDLVVDGLWNGTREMTLTTSKHGHEPRLLVYVEYDDNAYLGDLHREIGLELADGVPSEKAMRDITDGVLNITSLVDVLSENEDKIDSVTVRVNRRVHVRNDSAVGGGDVIENALTENLPGADITVEHD